MIFDLSVPLLGFENIKQFKLEKIDDIFMRLEAVGEEAPTFTLVNPFALREYSFEIPTQLQKNMEIVDSSNILTLNIMIVQENIEKSTINFAAPIVFNTDNNKMAQVILSDSKIYGIAENLSDFLDKEGN
ncbi:MAG: flagellar assembly protein FliW [Campylobacterota bacterium]|nr:flagellar assembly protein FliW [Campylobacterota bacterium]